MGSPYDLPEWAGFVARIRENPADDLPRLVAADWLDERGEHDRAEFIRVQCRIGQLIRGTTWVRAGIKNSPTDVVNVEVPTDRGVEPVLAALMQREDQLLHAAPSNPASEFYTTNAEAWLPPPLGIAWADKFGPQPPRQAGALNGGHVDYRMTEGRVEFGPNSVRSITFRRGFVALVVCSQHEWLARGPQVAVGGAVEYVEVIDCEPGHVLEEDAQGRREVWMWYREGAEGVDPGQPWALPAEVFDLLTDGDPIVPNWGWMAYPSHDAATSSLSAALISWALSQSRKQ